MKNHLLCVLAVAGFAFAGCSGETTSDNTLHLALETSPNRLDPAYVIDVAEGQICSMIFQGLVRFAPSGELVPGAARSWEVTDIGRRYTFHLDRRARFSNGRPLTSSDVVASFERVLVPGSRSSRQWVLDRISGARAFSDGQATAISGLEAPDDTTLIVVLAEPFRPFIQLLAMPAACVVPEDLAGVDEEAFATQPIGSGPWQLAAWERGDYLSLTPNPYYGGAKPALQEIRFRIIPEAFTRIAEFESGTLDILKIPQAELVRFLAEMGDRIQRRPELRVLYVGLNNGRGPLSDPRVRRALNMAVDVDQLIVVLTDGRATRATGAIPPTLAGYRERAPYAYDPAAARRLLSEAGYREGFSMEIWQRDSPDGNRIVEAVQGYLRDIGVDVKIVKREWSAFKEAVSQGRVDAFFLDWYADYPDAENFLYPLFHSANLGGGGNRAFVQNPEIDAMIEHAQTTPDAATGHGLYASVDSLVYSTAPWIYLYFPTTFVVVSPRVEDYVYPALYLGDDFSAVTKLAEGKP